MNTGNRTTQREGAGIMTQAKGFRSAFRPTAPIAVQPLP